MPQAAKACSKLIPLATRTVHLLLDRERHVVGVLAGHPNDKRWGQVHEDAFTKLQQAASTMSYSDKERNNRRGLFPTVAHGISFGGGRRWVHLFHPQASALIVSTGA